MFTKVSQNSVNSTATAQQHENVSHESREVANLHSDTDHYISVIWLEKLAMPGDMLEFQRGDYTDYALYLGNGKVMTFGLKDNTASKGTFQECALNDLTEDGKARVCNHEDVAQSIFNLSSKRRDAVVEKAKTFINVTVPYEFDFRNSEYYCTMWRYGIGFSTQAAQQDWLPTETDQDGKCMDVKARKNYFGADAYAKYKQMAVSKEIQSSDELC